MAASPALRSVKQAQSAFEELAAKLPVWQSVATTVGGIMEAHAASDTQRQDLRFVTGGLQEIESALLPLVQARQMNCSAQIWMLVARILHRSQP